MNLISNKKAKLKKQAKAMVKHIIKKNGLIVPHPVADRLVTPALDFDIELFTEAEQLLMGAGYSGGQAINIVDNILRGLIHKAQTGIDKFYSGRQHQESESVLS
jgi:uncharacterized protein YoaH (UPF0181 family)